MYEEEEYITNENDPTSIEKVTNQHDYTIIPNEEEIEFDQIFETISVKLTDMTTHNKIQTEKVLDALREGDL